MHALSLSELGDDAEAVKEAERAVELAPTDSEAHLNLAIAAARIDMERAIAETRRAIELGPENSSAYQMLMKCLLDSERYNEAAAFGPEWLAVSPFDVAAHSSLAVAMAQTVTWSTAARQFGYVMMLQPNADKRLLNCIRSCCRWRKRLMDCNDSAISQRTRRILRECSTNSRGCLRHIPTRIRAMASRQFVLPSALAHLPTGAFLLFSLR